MNSLELVILDKCVPFIGSKDLYLRIRPLCTEARIIADRVLKKRNEEGLDALKALTFDKIPVVYKTIPCNPVEALSHEGHRVHITKEKTEITDTSGKKRDFKTESLPQDLQIIDFCTGFEAATQIDSTLFTPLGSFSMDNGSFELDEAFQRDAQTHFAVPYENSVLFVQIHRKAGRPQACLQHNGKILDIAQCEHIQSVTRCGRWLVITCQETKERSLSKIYDIETGKIVNGRVNQELLIRGNYAFAIKKEGGFGIVDLSSAVATNCLYPSFGSPQHPIKNGKELAASRVVDIQLVNPSSLSDGFYLIGIKDGKEVHASVTQKSSLWEVEELSSGHTIPNAEKALPIKPIPPRKYEPAKIADDTYTLFRKNYPFFTLQWQRMTFTIHENRVATNPKPTLHVLQKGSFNYISIPLEPIKSRNSVVNIKVNDPYHLESGIEIHMKHRWNEVDVLAKL